MTSPPPKIRMTTPTRLVLDLLLATDPDDPPWGYRITEETGLGPGTVYPILERLEQAGWITGAWEDGIPEGRPRRRFYSLSGTGRVEYAAARASRRKGWVPTLGHITRRSN
ncbi:PadR family transcriptional regulator [Herbidospora cretacea]|uniref:PadR family transcriptional regulator n=1 Tax=Herbidospora cretacea TaxID=28444 RepID=UPI0007C7F294|nr:PadR family transcriptional regulator [Herbidospora cretacea]